MKCEKCGRELPDDYCGQICIDCSGKLEWSIRLNPTCWTMLEYAGNGRSPLEDCKSYTDYRLRVDSITLLVNLGLIELTITEKGKKELERHYLNAKQSDG